MKKISLFLLLLLTGTASAQHWTWIRGYASHGIPGNYGTMGVPSATNDPGVRHGCATWTDKQGNLWLFGGEGYDITPNEDLLNDLWKYDKSTNQWTWIKGSNTLNDPGNYGTMGVANPANNPGAREFAMSWTDTSGKFWLFGGEGYVPSATGEGALGDLWMYDPATNQWTWMKGFSTLDQNGVYGTIGVSSPNNMPGSRSGSGYWVDENSNLWLMGGDGFPAAGGSGLLQDLWKYVPATNEWTWVKGSDLTGQTGVYGVQNTAAAGNLPGGRKFPMCWYTPSGDAYMLGGAGHSTLTLGAGRLNDFWKYNSGSNNWTWVGGHNGINQDGHYGVFAQASSAVRPGARESGATWTDALGKLYLFGGYGYAGEPGFLGDLNDLLKYDPLLAQWAWVKGDSALNVPGDYGTVGQMASSNKPGGRHYNTYWKHTGSELWLFGGLGRDSTTALTDNLNDLWVYSAPCNPDNINSFSGSSLCCGISTTLSVQSPDGSPVTWYQSPTQTVAIGTGTNFATPPLWSQGSQSTFTYYVEAATCSLSPRAAVTLTVFALPQVTITAPVAACHNETVTMSAGGASTYTWLSGGTGATVTHTVSSPSYTAVVLATDTNGCSNSATATVTVHPLPFITIAGSSSVCNGVVITFTGQGAQSYTWHTASVSPFLTHTATAPGNTIMVSGTDGNGCTSSTVKTISVQAGPALSAGPSSPSICLGEALTFTSSGASTYSWSTGNTTQNFSLAPQADAHYTLTGFADGCSSVIVFSVAVNSCSGLSEETYKSQVEFFPNPFTTALNVYYSSERSSAALRVFNGLGQEVHRQILNAGINLLNTEKLAAGVYYISVEEEGHKLRRFTLLKQH